MGNESFDELEIKKAVSSALCKQPHDPNILGVGLSTLITAILNKMEQLEVELVFARSDAQLYHGWLSATSIALGMPGTPHLSEVPSAAKSLLDMSEVRMKELNDYFSLCQKQSQIMEKIRDIVSYFGVSSEGLPDAVKERITSSTP